MNIELGIVVNLVATAKYGGYLEDLRGAVDAYVYPAMSIYTPQQAREIHDEVKPFLVKKGYLEEDGTWTDLGNKATIRDLFETEQDYHQALDLS